MRASVLILFVMTATVATAQQSASYEIESAVLNGGGRPGPGGAASSAGFTLSSEALGEAVAAAPQASPSYTLVAGILPPYGPAAEVTGLRFGPSGSLQWDPHPTAFRFNVYRGGLGDLPANYGTCVAPDLSAVEWIAAATPAAGSAFFYLVKAEDRLGEEGPLAPSSTGPRAGGTSCP